MALSLSSGVRGRALELGKKGFGLPDPGRQPLFLVDRDRFLNYSSGVVGAARKAQYLSEIEAHLGPAVSVRSIDERDGLAPEALGLFEIASTRENFGLDGLPESVRLDVLGGPELVRGSRCLFGLVVAALSVERLGQVAGHCREERPLAHGFENSVAPTRLFFRGGGIIRV